MSKHRHSSDKVAALASRVLHPDNDPLSDDKVRQILDGVAGVEDLEKARFAIRTALGEFIGDAKSLAGSVMSQADGPE